MRASALSAAAAALLTLALASAQAADHDGLASNTSFVPWKVLNAGDPPPAAVLLLYWIPRSRDDFRRSELLTYRPLTMYAPQCVALTVVQANDEPTIARLGAAGKLPIAVLTTADGHVVGVAENERGALRAAAVDKLLRDAIHARELAFDHDLDDAPNKLAAGDRDSAIILYRRVWEQRCLFPRHGREAERALRKLGAF